MVATGSREMREASNDLAAKTEEQSASIKNVARTTAELLREFKENSEAWGETRATALEAKADADRGSEAIKGAAEAMERIDEIAGKSDKSLTGIEHINEAMALLARAMQQNAAMAEQTSAASAELMQSAGDLKSHIASFDYGGPARGSGEIGADLRAAA
ncbi:hypothetical protein [Erythrobacter sp.]|jgi:methyl-accepting chemotaxis protein|uniref:hypothetical protein n=1 Tax=Erythrobacter sp. TaxID=1042 RepID=UPI002EC8D03D|nr:hypothetical protein [Erythrobacter sp.]